VKFQNLTRIGIWDPTKEKRLNWTRTQTQTLLQRTEDLKAAKFKVTLKKVKRTVKDTFV
jgi:hypothetical protein